MHKYLGLTLLLGVMLALPVVNARADDESDGTLPEAHVLPCQTKCADFKPPQLISAFDVAYLSTWPGGGPESAVKIDLHINEDGHVSDAFEVFTVGSRKFTDAAVNAAKSLIYKPATVDGKPVATFMNPVFLIGPPGYLRSKTRTAISRIEETAKDESPEAILAKLKVLAADEDLCFVERAFLDERMSVYYIKAGHPLEAEDATHQGMDFMEGAIEDAAHQGVDSTQYTQEYNNLAALKVEADLHSGDLADATENITRLKPFGFLDLTKLVADARAHVDTMPFFDTMGYIVAENPPALSSGKGSAYYFNIPLYRRTFSFHQIKGKLSHFTLVCEQHVIQYDVSDNAQWHVPADWRNCTVTIAGDPGTTFLLSQFKD